ncbi:MAG: UDP-N-acetylglucosamine 2-epimerase (non-hydrolyzing) [Bacteroidota bacterium]|nr:UDP-N-acetylglucosamine 2-epimerase (non-hydrolyzing) [Bacteroidota bacterium]
MHKILIVFGTRPELIKLAPIINEFCKRNLRERLYIINTNQHKDFLQQDLDYFHIDVDHQFKLNRNDDSLSLLNGLLLLEFNELKSKLKDLKITIDAILGQGDTCTSYSAAQYAFYEKTPFIHIEAGLRTDDLCQPFPEEYFRKMISTITAIHFAPTAYAEKKLINEGIAANSIVVTGNTVIDNLKQLKNINEFKNIKTEDNKLVLITVHRRENIKNNLPLITKRIIHYIKNNPDKSFIWVDNPGYKIEPNISIQLNNLKIIQPVSFFEMIEFYKRAQLIITDSGGIQEEAAYLGIPTLLFRTKTERIEGIISGISKYIEDSDNDLDSVIKALNKNRLTKFNTIYGDGNASKRIVDILICERKLISFLKKTSK